MAAHTAQDVIRDLGLVAHEEGGFFKITPGASETHPCGGTDAYSTIMYMLTKESPIGFFHNNVSDISHYFHLGGAVRYTTVSPDGVVEQFVLGGDIANGQLLQLVVRGGYWKSSELIEGDYTLVSECCVPSFKFRNRTLITEHMADSKFPTLKTQRPDLLPRCLHPHPGKFVFHMTPKEYYASTTAGGRPYVASGFEAEKFTHCCSTVEESVEVANAFLKGIAGPMLLLVLDEYKLKGLVFEEPATPPGFSLPAALRHVTVFPHVYAPIDGDAVAEVHDMPRTADGSYLELALPDTSVVHRET
eukprot:Opistho-2@65140